ncbi:2631_t:CDS:2, partial [Scutellospora calospora]
ESTIRIGPELAKLAIHIHSVYVNSTSVEHSQQIRWFHIPTPIASNDFDNCIEDNNLEIIDNDDLQVSDDNYNESANIAENENNKFEELSNEENESQ